MCSQLEEELGIRVETSQLLPLTFASHAYPDQGFHLLMPVFKVTDWEGEPQGAEGQNLAWASAEELGDFAMPPADGPLIPDIRKALSDPFGDERL